MHPFGGAIQDHLNPRPLKLALIEQTIMWGIGSSLVLAVGVLAQELTLAPTCQRFKKK